MTKLSHDLFAVLPNEHYPKTFPKGSDCPDALLEVAASLGYLDEKPKRVRKPKV